MHLPSFLGDSRSGCQAFGPRGALDRKEWLQLPTSNFFSMESYKQSTLKVEFPRRERVNSLGRESEFPCTFLPALEWGVCSQGCYLLQGFLSPRKRWGRPRKESQRMRGDSWKFLSVRSPRKQVFWSLRLTRYFLTSLPQKSGSPPSASTLSLAGPRPPSDITPSLLASKMCSLSTGRWSSPCEGKERACRVQI